MRMPNLLISLSLLSACTSFAGDDEEISFDALPSAVKETLKAFPMDSVLKVESEKEDGVVEYELKYKHNGLEKEIELDANGKILEFETDQEDHEDEDEHEDAEESEEEVAFASLPASIQKQFKLIRYSEILEAEKELEDGVLIYEVEFKDGDEEKEAKFSAKGELLSLEEEDDDDEENEDED